jgi:hypothetical protein
MTATEIAVDWIRPYVNKGLPPDHLEGTYMGEASDRFKIQIGAYANEKKHKPYEVIVTKIDKQPCYEVFTLAQLWQQAQAPKPVQMTLF